MPPTKDLPEVVRFESGVCYDAASNERIDLESSTGQAIREAAEQYGKTHGDKSWDQLSGQFRFDQNTGQLMETNAGR